MQSSPLQTSDASTATNAGVIRPKLPRRSVIRFTALLILMAGAMVAIYFSPVRGWLQNGAMVREWLSGSGGWRYPVAALGVAALVAAGVPRLLLCAIGSMAIGFLPGLVLTQAGTLLGYYGVFLFVRWGGRDLLVRRYPRIQRFAQFIGRQGLIGVILVRQLPVHGTLVNVCLGVSSLRHRHFLIGTAIGLIPEAIPVALAGAGVVEDSLKETVSHLALAAACFLAISVFGAYMYRRLSNSAQGAAVMYEVSSLNEGVQP